MKVVISARTRTVRILDVDLAISGGDSSRAAEFGPLRIEDRVPNHMPM